MRTVDDVTPLLRLETVSIANFRIFERVELRLDERLTVLHAENAGGKTALLSALGVALGATLYGPFPTLRPSDVRESIAGTLTRRRHYPSVIAAVGLVAGEQVEWARSLPGPGRRTTNAETKAVRNRLEPVFSGNGDWPVVASYGTQRLWSVVSSTAPRRGQTRREDGYTDALDPRSKEKQLLEWLFRAALSRAQGRASPEFIAFENALRDALLPVLRARGWKSLHVEFDIANNEPVIQLGRGAAIPWSQLSDGYHSFLGMVADLARRCITLNPHLGAGAVRGASGVVLIDEVDLHLHPQWQREVVPSLLEAFPGLQFVVSTHSPQVLSSVTNAQVRTLRDGAVVRSAPVDGRDSNSILLESFGTAERSNDSANVRTMRALEAALDQKDLPSARRLLDELMRAWGPHDDAVVRLQRALSWAETP